MRYVTVAAGFVVLLSLGMVGCGDSHDAAVGDLVTTLEEIGEALEDIETREEAEAAVGQLTPLAERMKDAEQRMDSLGEVPAEENRVLLDNYRDRMSEAMNRIVANMLRLEQADAFEPLEPVFASMGMGPADEDAAANPANP